MKKCPMCGYDGCRDDDMFCVECGSPLFVYDQRNSVLVEYLLKNGLISSPEDIERTVMLEVEINSDDGLLPVRKIGKKLVCPLYYTENDILQAAVRAKIIHSREFHYIMDLFTYEYRTTSVMGEFPRTKECGPFVLAEAKDVLASGKLSITYGHRAEMMSRAAPGMCLYGCPASSEIEKKFFDTVYKTEIISLDE